MILIFLAILIVPLPAAADNLSAIGKIFIGFIAILTLISIIIASVFIYIFRKSQLITKNDRTTPVKEPRDTQVARPSINRILHSLFALVGAIWGMFAGFSFHLFLGEAGGYLAAALLTGAGTVGGYLLGTIMISRLGLGPAFVILFHGIIAAIGSGIIAESVGVISATIPFAFIAGTALGSVITVKIGHTKSLTSLTASLVLSILVFAAAYSALSSSAVFLMIIPFCFIIFYTACVFLLKIIPWQRLFTASLAIPVFGLIGLIIAITSGSDELYGFLYFSAAGLIASLITFIILNNRKIKIVYCIPPAIAFILGTASGIITAELVDITETAGGAIGGFGFYIASLFAMHVYLKTSFRS